MVRSRDPPPTGARRKLVKARRESSEAQYMKFMRSQFNLLSSAR